MEILRMTLPLYGSEAAVTIAVNNLNQNMSSIGCAYRSPEDSLWRKKSATIAKGRAVKNPILVCNTENLLGEDGKFSIEKTLKITRQAIRTVVKSFEYDYPDPIKREKHSHLPRWLSDFLDVWDKEFERSLNQKEIN